MGWRGGITGRRFDAAGNPVGIEFLTGIAAAGRPDVAIAPSGDFVVVGDVGQGTGLDVLARCYDATGTPKGPVFMVNSYVTSAQGRPRAAADSNGRVVVVWNGEGQDGSFSGVIARAFDPSCNALGLDQVVNARTTGDQTWPDVVADASNAFLVTWTDFKSPQRLDVMGRRISSSGAFRGGEFEVQVADPTVAASGGLYPNVAGGPEGAFAVVWYENASVAKRREVFGRRLTALGARALDVDGLSGPTSDGNRVLEPGEVVRVAPSWFNSVENPIVAGGQASSFSGPAGTGVSYTVPDPGAAYGAISPGAVGTCTSTGDCYRVGIVQADARPVQHWDATFVEDLEPLPWGRAKWTLHVGDSFQDVPRSNPYYRFVETLLHSGVSGGCAAGQFCPASPTSREQMAVLVLKAREGPGYTPPACQFTLFVDVPPSSPYCPYINELVFRDVVGGCAFGPPNYYCPSSPVSREQMAVFVLRTLDPALSPPACTTPMFADVPASSPFCRWIEELARRGITSGCGGGNYCPTQPVSREQMSVFLAATFGLVLYGP